MFTEFAVASGLPVDPGSITSRDRPEPDISFALDGRVHFAELVEITDEGLARRHSIAVKTRTLTGGWLSLEGSIHKAFQSKSQKKYQTNGAGLWLLAYYDKEYPPSEIDPELIHREVDGIGRRMVESHEWNQLWVYDSWNRRVLWSHP